jgi:hypothetical protein
MVQTCTKCSRANPSDAVYCYFDGFVLGGGHSRNGGPVAIGSQRFGSPFVFPTGRACGSFDELALACQEEWKTARDLLRQGYLEGFLGGLGRVDLAMAAREAAKFPDPDRGLDQLLSKLPSDVLAAPLLKVDPLEINLGVLDNSSDRSFQLTLDNQGMRLLHGTVSCDGVPWLTLGETPGVSQKHFEFQHELKLPIRVCGDRLRAGNKPQEAKVLIESNGGTTTLVVRAEVPVKPYPSGLLAGAKSPRQVAEKAKANPKESAAIFERGEVAEWYKSNGWTYPVQGPAASGMGAVQQFFEALGLVPAPKVEISTRAILLSGNPGQALNYTVEVKTAEKKYVYASGSSDESWLRVGKPKLKGPIATVPLSIPSVPNYPGQTLTAQLTIQANGNQRFVIPVTVQVGNEFDLTGGGPFVEVVEPVAVMPVAVTPVAVAPVPVRPVAVNPVVVPVSPVAVMPVAVAPSPLAEASADPFGVTDDSPFVSRRRRSGGGRAGAPLWVHSLPALLLGAAVLGVVVVDLFNPLKGSSGTPDGPKTIAEETENLPQDIYVSFRDSDQRFGIKIKIPDPNDPKRATFKRLTFADDGAGNNTCVMIDRRAFLFGAQGSPFKWIRKRVEIRPNRSWESEIEYTIEKIRITQHVEIVPGKSRRLDTCLIWYSIENRDTQPHEVGLRILIDTFIGGNDGVPFTVPGENQFLTTRRDFKPAAKVPPYLEAMEDPDNPKESGVVARIGLKNIAIQGFELDPVDRAVVAKWPGRDEGDVRWEWQFEDIGNDSCVAVYWEPKLLEPKRSKDTTQPRTEYARDLAMTYGLGLVDISEGVGQTGGLAFSDPGTVAPNAEFVLTAYVYNAKADQRVKLRLDPGLSLAPGEEAEKPVSRPGKRVPISWKVRAGSAGTYEANAESGPVKTKPLKIVVKSTSIVG